MKAATKAELSGFLRLKSPQHVFRALASYARPDLVKLVAGKLTSDAGEREACETADQLLQAVSKKVVAFWAERARALDAAETERLQQACEERQRASAVVPDDDDVREIKAGDGGSKRARQPKVSVSTKRLAAPRVNEQSASDVLSGMQMGSSVSVLYAGDVGWAHGRVCKITDKRLYVEWPDDLDDDIFKQPLTSFFSKEKVVKDIMAGEFRVNP